MNINTRFTGRMVKVSDSFCIDADNINSLSKDKNSIYYGEMSYTDANGQKNIYKINYANRNAEGANDKFNWICEQINTAKTNTIGEMIDLTA